MSRILRLLSPGLLILALAACASGPLKTEGVATGLTPANAARADGAGRTILWGGVVAAARNLPERTRLEVVAYPLDARSQRPKTGAEPVGRFLAYRDGYLETAEYAPGRRVTVRGRLTGTEEGRVGDAPYAYPAVDVEALELWPERRERGEGPRFHFGIGVIFGG